MGWAIVGTIAGLLLIDLLIRVPLIRIVIPMIEHAPPFNAEKWPPDPDAERISFTSTDGVSLRGSWHRQLQRPPRGLIVFCQEFSGQHWASMSYCAGLWEAGFDILAFDFRNQGESDRTPCYEPLHWLTEYEVRDLLGALQFVRDHEELRGLPLGLFGISRGGGAALTAAARNRGVQGVACEGAFSTNGLMMHYACRWVSLLVPTRLLNLVPKWHIRVTLLLARWMSQLKNGCRYTNLERCLPRLRNRSVLLITGERDTYVLPELTQKLSEKIGGGRCEVWVAPGAKHNMARQVDAESYDGKLVTFFANALTRTHSATHGPEPVRKTPI